MENSFDLSILQDPILQNNKLTEKSIKNIYDSAFFLSKQKLWPEDNEETTQWLNWLEPIKTFNFTNDRQYYKFLENAFLNINNNLEIYGYDFLRDLYFFLEQSGFTGIYPVPKNSQLDIQLKGANIEYGNDCRKIFRPQESDKSKYDTGISNTQIIIILDHINNKTKETECEYGSQCTRKNPEHFKRCKHSYIKDTLKKKTNRFHPYSQKNNFTKKTIKTYNSRGGKLNRNTDKTKRKTIRKTTRKRNITKNDIKKLTDKFIDNVINNNPKSVNNLFCKNSVLLGTLSRKIRTKKNNKIRKYFDYFANKKGITVKNKKYNIQKIDDNIFMNNAFIKWRWTNQKEPVTTRMSFIIKNRCLYLLHSSTLPLLNKTLKQYSSSSDLRIF